LKLFDLMLPTTWIWWL